ncbi:hypothetical protein [Sneathiella sp. HT1-7]|jgi:hypothetical protein|uniref:hypothetical protein n=1 Tax=Sneathiella sp. HT1-7 TaxID=2887192 RepID=UPI001D1404A0|nr:hypothetical protein [Sneathiella sp. HT1-7]MCC3304530.1 hypothetical protein [Sneathiella sp. HT1-7]
MFARNEKYGDALQLPYGPATGARFDSMSVNRHFGLSGLLQSLRKRIRLATEQNTAVVDLASSYFGKTVNNGHEITGEAVNENCLRPTIKSNNR